MASSTAFQGSVPANYDKYLGPLFFEPYAQDLVQRFNTLCANKILELACGTGRLTQHLVQLLHPKGMIYATDLDTPMLELGRNKLPDARICWQVADAQELPYKNEYFDLVVCQFGVMFFADKLKAFKETWRVLKPNGTFLFLTWDDVCYNDVSYETQLVLQQVLPNDPPVFSQKGPYSYFNQDQILSDLQEAGFRNISLTPQVLMGQASQPDDIITGVLEGSPLTSYLMKRGADKGSIRDLLRTSLLTYQQSKSYQFSMKALYCQGTK